ncbi:MAG TPA: DUF3307 domain-containing protein [Elusimicrobiota bacterium]|nr:DUF3307 domain-containing protein [Elusimicrobiota bacterium]
MEVFWRLLFGHLLGDFTLQTNYVAAWKRRGPAGLLFHVGTHIVLYVFLAWPYLGTTWIHIGPWALNGWAGLGLIFVSHVFEDQWRIWSVTAQRAPDNLLFYIWDQVIHIVILFALAPVTSDRIIENTWPVMGCLVVAATHFTTVSVFFIEKDLFNMKFPPTREKYGAMAQRFLVFLCLLLPSAWAWLVLGAVGLQVLVRRQIPSQAVSKTGLVLGNGLALLAGLLARRLYFA